DSVRGRIERSVNRYKDPRLTDLKTRFQSLEQLHKTGKQSNTQYQSALVAMGGELDRLEFQLDPEFKSKWQGPPPGGEAGDAGKVPPPAKGNGSTGKKRRP